jgi:L-ribulokinase
MASLEKKTYLPIPENVEVYNQLFTEYRKLHDYFGLGDNQTMERLKRK